MRTKKSEQVQIEHLTNSQRRCVHSVGRLGFWDAQPRKYRRECIDLGLMEWRDGAKLTVEGKRVYAALVQLKRTSGSYLR